MSGSKLDTCRQSASKGDFVLWLQDRYHEARERCVTHGGDFERGKAIELRKIIELLTE